MKPSYLTYLKPTGDTITTDEGVVVPVWELGVPTDPACLKEWACHFRRHYCSDAELIELCEDTGGTKAEYLFKNVFPDETKAPGPSIRAGDFAELVISDYVEFMLGFWVPRDKYGEKESRNESAKGVDILGFKMLSPTYSPSDELITFEVKAQLSGTKYVDRLQVAINDSAKDYIRAGASLHAAKRRCIRSGDAEKKKIVGRFQNFADRPYVLRFGAVAMLSDISYNVDGIKKSTISTHKSIGPLELLVVKGTELMKLVHAIYQEAANEA
jgi:hypothetical protein